MMLKLTFCRLNPDQKIVRAMLAVVVVVTLVSVVRAGDPTYPIKLSRLCRVGDQWTEQVTSAYDISKRYPNPGDTRKPVDTHVDGTLEGLVTVDEVSADGRPTEVTIKVKSCTKNGNSVMAADTTISTKHKDGHIEFQVNGQPSTADVRKVLEPLIQLDRPDGPTLDEQAGTDQPRKVGDSWPFNAEPMARTASLPFKVLGKEMTGEVTLKDVSTKEGHQSQTVNISTVCKFDTRPGKNGIVFNDLNLLRHRTITAPMDQKSNAYADKIQIELSYVSVDSTGKHQIAEKVTTQTICKDVVK